MTQPDSGRPRELFLSHADFDRDVVDRLSAELTRHGIPHWYSRRELVGAQQWHYEIGAALERADWFCVVLSPRSVASRWVKWELMYALPEPRFDGRIIPILLEECHIGRLSWVLNAFQRIDFRTSWEAGMRDLLRVWGMGYRD